MSGPPIERHYHVDDFIDDPKSDRYAASWFEQFRRPAIEKMRKPDERKLFATYKGKRHMVTGCSRFGDVWLHSDLKYTGMSYELRVDVDDCSMWAPVPQLPAAPAPRTVQQSSEGGKP